MRQYDDGKWQVETKGYGVKDRHNTPVTENSLFSIASNSKLFAALSLGIMVSDPEIILNWDTKIASLLPNEWLLQDPMAEKGANLVDILSHRTGLPRHDNSFHPGQTVEEVVCLLP